MSAVDQFFQAVREVFAKNRDANWTEIGLLLAAAVVVTIGLSVGLGRWRSRRRVAGRIHAVANAAGLTEAELDHLKRMAAAVGLPALEVMSSLAPFEHATAAALASEVPPLRPGANSAFDQVRRLRKALGFSPLSPHLWLLTTRELVEGDPVAMGDATGRVVEVNEASFAVDLPLPAAPELGASAPLTIDRADDSRYLARVRLLAVEVPPGSGEGAAAGPAVRRLYFAHDEQPDRRQHREYVRVRVQGTVTVRSVEPATATADPSIGGGAEHPAPAPTMAGTLVDVSAGGLALDLPTSSGAALRRGARLRCSFTLGNGDTFPEVAALVVAAVAGPRAGVQHVRLSFTSLTEAARDRLAAAVTRHQRRPLPEAGGT